MNAVSSPSMFQAIAAMSENRVIGNRGKIPWHIPDDFRWFKHKTMGGTLIMGRKTFESIGKPLPGRKTVVLSRTSMVLGAESYRDIAGLEKKLPDLPSPYWICGGSEIFQQLLPKSPVLYVTRVKRRVQGDAVMPSFEQNFSLSQIIHETPEFRVERWINRQPGIILRLVDEAWPIS